MDIRKKRKEKPPEAEEPATKKPKTEKSQQKVNNWSLHELVAEIEGIPDDLAKTIIKLFEDDCMIPFLCRYRKELIENLSPERLREIKNTIDHVKQIETKSQSIIKALEKDNLLTDEISRSISCVKSLEELEHLSAMYKPASKGSLFDRAQKIGLEPAAESILYGTQIIDSSKLVNPKVEGLKTAQEVEDGIKNILSHLIAKNEPMMNEVRNLRTRFGVTISASQMKQKKTETKVNNNQQKFENYFNFSCPADRIKPHQILALNRGESLKVLSVKHEVDDRLKEKLKTFATKFFLGQGRSFTARSKLFADALNDSYRKKISPLIIRQTQSELSRRADAAAVESFATNLKNLLLTKPVKGRKILGIDPGFASGCKLAMISETGQLLETNHVIYVHDKSKLDKSAKLVSGLLEEYDCTLIALGNATACRETEIFISNLIEARHQAVEYCIVSEQGASIYSCSDIAKKEFPKLDVSFIGAISIARRLLDPLCELVKIDPKHLGVGMYQHDVSEKSLKKSLDEIISECVSFVGVDLNTASLSLLKHIAGLTEKRAEAILKYRESNGLFLQRQELLKVKSIGAKTFTQCAGFLKINALSAGSKKINLFDSTNVHPESYDIAIKIIKKCGLKLEDIGRPKFVEKIQQRRLQEKDKSGDNSERIASVLEALSQSFLHDYRSDVKIEPIFKKGVVKIESLKPKQIVTGVVTNITDFGAFIDLGVGKNGLIHVSAMRGAKLKVSDKIECTVLNVDVAKGRIGLEFKSIFS